ncbi:MAG: hypothetical protein AB1521_05705 [Bacteroidota bacterium]
MICKKLFLLITALVLVGLLSSCADAIQYQYSQDIQQVGFWYGLWHGLIAPISFIISLFDDSIAVYAVYNNGGWYNFGFLLGLSISLGGSGKASCKKSWWRK